MHTLGDALLSIADDYSAENGHNLSPNSATIAVFGDYYSRQSSVWT